MKLNDMLTSNHSSQWFIVAFIIIAISLVSRIRAINIQRRSINWEAGNIVCHKAEYSGILVKSVLHGERNFSRYSIGHQHQTGEPVIESKLIIKETHAATYRN
jgi:hypothetical protein